MENSKTFIEEEDRKEFLEHFEKIMVLCNKQVECIDFLENIIKRISDYSLEGIIKFAENDKNMLSAVANSQKMIKTRFRPRPICRNWENLHFGHGQFAEIGKMII